MRRTTKDEERPARSTPSITDAARGLASAAVARAAWACWVRSAMPLDDLYAAVGRLLPGLSASGARWGGAGVLPEFRSEWYGFQGGAGSCLVFAFDASTLPELEERRMSLIRSLLQPFECRLSERGDVPSAIVRAIRASRVVPVWELPGLAHLAPGACDTEGFPTLAA